MFTLERHEKLLAYLAKHKSIRVSQASEWLGVTEKTIRLDLERLEERKLLKRVHGGAVLMETDTSLFPIQEREQRNEKEKHDIAEKAKSLICENDVILLDGGSTTLALAERLGDKPMTVITNDIRIANALYEKEAIQLILLGGTRLGTSSALYSQQTTAMLKSLYVQKVFLGATGVSLDHGLSILNSFHYEWKRAAINCGRKTILLSDSSKFGQVGLMRFADITEIDELVSDDLLDSETRNVLEEEYGINVN